VCKVTALLSIGPPAGAADDSWAPPPVAQLFWREPFVDKQGGSVSHSLRKEERKRGRREGGGIS
jgi:hypothetical protein